MKARWDSWKLVGKIRKWLDRLRGRVGAHASVERLRKWFGRPLVPSKAQSAAGRVGATLLGAGVISIFVDAMLRPAGLVPIIVGALLLHYYITSPAEKD